MNFKSIGLQAGFAAVAVSAAAISAAPAHAISFYIDAGPTSARPGATKVTFGEPDFGLVPTNGKQVPTFENGGIDFAPAASNRPENGGFNLSKEEENDSVRLQRETQGTNPDDSSGNFLADIRGVGNFLFEKNLFYFGFNWGSINPDNIVQFYQGATTDEDGALVGNVTGAQILAALGASQKATPTAFVNFFSEDGKTDIFNRVLITRSNQPFQLDDVAYKAVPTPALLPALLGLGAAAWRKRKQAVKAEA